MDMKIIQHICLLVASTGLALTAHAQVYQAPITDSNWTFSGNRVACHLTHQIPNYGIAVFDQLSGERVSFTLRADAYVPPINTAVLTAVSPVWMHDVPATKLALVKAKAHQVSLKSGVSERMLQTLTNGRFPEFSYQVKSTGARVKVAMSSINFLEAMVQFEACRQNLLPYSRKEVNQQLSLFTSGSTKITHKNRKLLSKASTYIKESGNKERIDLVSGTDAFSVKDGRRIYDKRIQSIRESLQQSGLSEDRVVALDDPEALDTPKGSVRLKVAGPEPFRHIYFNSGSIYLNKRDHAKLDFMLDYLRLQNPKATLVLKGHTDSKGNRYANLKVSKKRVKVIKDYLISKGLSRQQIVTQAYGESKPRTTNRYPGGRQLNRRVDISIVS